jgi:hypothetical protein
VRIDSSYSAISTCGRMGIGGNNGNTRTSGDFSNILQERVSKAAGSESDDLELKAYGRQLALESGIAFRNEEFLYQLNQLLDRGLISREDVINSVEFPPKTIIKDDGSRGYELDINGFGKKMKDIELTNDLNLLKAIKR